MVLPYIFDSSSSGSSAYGFQTVPNCSRALGIRISNLQLSCPRGLHSLPCNGLVVGIDHSDISIVAGLDAPTRHFQCKSGTSPGPRWYFVLRLRSSNVCLDRLFDSNSSGPVRQSTNALPAILLHRDWAKSSRVQLGQRSPVGKTVPESQPCSVPKRQIDSVSVSFRSIEYNQDD